MTTSFTDDEILEGIRWTTDATGAELRERTTWTFARLMVERDEAREMARWLANLLTTDQVTFNDHPAVLKALSYPEDK